MKPLVVEEIGKKLEGLTAVEALGVIDLYFSHEIWSLEKEEWGNMSDTEKLSFARYAIKYEK